MISRLTRWCWSYLERTSYFHNLRGKQFFEASMRKPIPCSDLRGHPVIRNGKVEETLKRTFTSKFGGVSVIVAPTSSGKSTYLRDYSNKFTADSQGFIQYFASELRTRKQFFDAFGGKERESDLFSIIPKNSVIILDRVDDVKILTSDMKNLFRHLALESRRISGINVILSTSNLSVAETVLKLNGNDKFQHVGSSKDFQWSEKMIDGFIENSEEFNLWSVDDRKQLRERAMHAKSPGFLMLVANLALEAYPKNDEVLRDRAEKYSEAWRAFNKYN
jgi:hypothetical protein